MLVLLLAAYMMSGCARIIGGQDTEFYRADSFLKEKKYPEAITAYRQIAQENDNPERAANAQFALASALAYYDNPQKDYELALHEFDEFLTRYPDSDKAPEAQQWRSLLHTIVDLEKENENLARNVEQYKQNIEHLNKNIEQLKQLDIMHEKRRMTR
jgi:outer membrane protein assembly factor BamD (BamD/ComL family)